MQNFPVTTSPTAVVTITVEGYLKGPPLPLPDDRVELAFDYFSTGRKKKRDDPAPSPQTVIARCSAEQFKIIEKEVEKGNPRLLVTGVPEVVTGDKPYLCVKAKSIGLAEPCQSGFISPLSITWIALALLVTITRLLAPVLVPIPFILLLAVAALYQVIKLVGWLPGFASPFISTLAVLVFRFDLILELLWLVLVYAGHAPLR